MLSPTLPCHQCGRRDLDERLLGEALPYGDPQSGEQQETVGPRGVRMQLSGSDMERELERK
jgi:hypothetical protein